MTQDEMDTALAHGGLKVGDTVRYGDAPHRVIAVYEGCDEIVIAPDNEAEGFDVLWWSVQKDGLSP